MPLLAVRVNDETHKRFKLWCVQRDRNMSEVLRRLISDWIAEQDRLDKKKEALQDERAL